MNCRYLRVGHCVILSVIASAAETALSQRLTRSLTLMLRRQISGLSVLQTLSSHIPDVKVKFFPSGYTTFCQNIEKSYKRHLRTLFRTLQASAGSIWLLWTPISDRKTVFPA